MLSDASQALLNRFPPGLRDSGHDVPMVRMSPVKFSDQWGYRHRLPERNRMNPDQGTRLRQKSGGTEAESLRKPSAAPWLCKQDDKDNRRRDQKKDIIEEVPHTDWGSGG